MTDLNVEKSVFQYLSVPLIDLGYAKDKIAFTYENAPQLTGDYVILSIQSYQEDRKPERRYKYIENTDKKLKEQILYRGTITVSVDFWGDKALESCRRLKSLLYSTEIIELAQKLNLGLQQTGTIRNLSSIWDTKYVSRGSYEINLHYSEAEEVLIETFGKTTVIGSGRVQVDKTIEEENYTP